MKSNLIIFDQPVLYAEGLSKLLSQTKIVDNIEVCSCYLNLLDCINIGNFNLLMFSSNIMMLSEIYQAAEEIKQKHPHLKIIIIGNDYDVTSIRKLFNKGITAYLDNISTFDEFICCLQAVIEGNIFLCAHAKEKMISFVSNGKNFESSQIKDSLTKRETEILKLICDGLSSKDISAKLFISINTVETHRKKILTKLNVRNSVGIVKYALENNIID
ncbi:DNA-binding response regulator, NarL/FixJ family, contains REC and HTH domains [Chryseobacterium piscicola]|uniref:DNA-binding response regulator, NarL/FixJ family, contains REC and HTH domains n=1 Tax=Chryseobacterium piscicola TaxID=551459 RepID=A0A1N7MRL5_9FLAO|nr:response regulator transcription factor [Chryseobacterium piscicola]PQA93365.1 LuxR family transcriptional regulator [Chryseobacterium piscicola]SIS88777.1 DNA-binding response regulator, NarL/FixJ family, contains REC and HTH domains [Chryseobacterium piscicola]